MSVLAIRDLSVRFGTKPILESVTLGIQPGEFVGLIGPNGAGKSTLLKAALNLIDHQGHVHLNGKDSQLMSAHERAQIASYLPQEREVHWPVSVEKLVSLGRSGARGAFVAPTEIDRAAVTAAMIRMDISYLRDRPATELSGGERARVLIARVLAQETPLILADEPTAGLDPSHQIALMRGFADLAAEGTAIVACLHEIPLAARYCNRIIVVHNGTMIADGTPRTVLTQAMMRSVYGVDAFQAEHQSELVVLPWDLSEKHD